jgi:hypothetical protein
VPVIFRRFELEERFMKRTSLGMQQKCISQGWYDPASGIRTGIELLLHIFRNWQTGNYDEAQHPRGTMSFRRRQEIKAGWRNKSPSSARFAYSSRPSSPVATDASVAHLST